ncbi:putative ribonuclease H-like domain-containing protein [Tanacetum coccineum]
MVLRAVLMKSGLVSVNTARQINTAHSKTTVNAARPMSHLSKIAHSTVKRPIHKNTAFKNSNINQRGNPQIDLQDQGVIDSGCSRHMTGNMSYLTDYEEIDGGYVAFGGNPKGGKITRKDDYSRFTWVFFLATKDETSGILKSFITGIENLVDHKVKVIRCDNGTEFKNKEMNQFCEMKGILRQFSVAKTPQQNRLAERGNRILIKAARTMLVDSKLATTFWAKAVNTACYVQNRVYKAVIMMGQDVEETELVNITFCILLLDWKFNVVGAKTSIELPLDPNMPELEDYSIFDISRGDEDDDAEADINNLDTSIQVSPNPTTRIHKDHPLDQVIGYLQSATQTRNMSKNLKGNDGFCTKASDNAGQARKETELVKYYILLPLWTVNLPYSQYPKSSEDDGFKPLSDDGKKVDEDPRKENECNDQEKEDNVNSTNNVNATGTNEVNAVGAKTSIELPLDPNMPELEDYSIFDISRGDEDDDAEADMNNLDTSIQVSPNPTTRIHKDHPLDQVIGDLQSATQTRNMSKNLKEHGFIEAMQEELLQFKLQEVWTLVDLPNGKRAIGTKWVFRNKKDERRIMIRNKARLVTQGYTQEEGIDYDEVFSPVARIKAIRLFLAYASFKDFVVYQMHVKSAFLYGKIEEELYVCQPPGFEDPYFPDRVYKVEKALYGLHQAPRDWYAIRLVPLLLAVIAILFVRSKLEGCCKSCDYKDTLIKIHHGAVHFKGGVKKIFNIERKDSVIIKDDMAERKYEDKVISYKNRRYGSQRWCMRKAEKETWETTWRALSIGVSYNTIWVQVYYVDTIRVLLLPLEVRIQETNIKTVSVVRENVHTTGYDQHRTKKEIGSRMIQEMLQALVDGKKIIITESIVRRDLQLEDAEGVDCLPNATIFEQLTLMGYEKILQKLTFYKAFFSPQWKFLIHTVLQCLSSKTTAWNKFSNTMASAIICLATNQKFNFSKYIFESMVKNLDNVGKFFMYPRFVQVFLDKQLEGMATHDSIHIAPSHTKKIFANMRRSGKDFSGRVTPLFSTMVVQSQPDMGEDNVADEAVNEEMDDSLERAATTATSLDAEQDRGNINKTQSKVTLNEPSSIGTSSGSGPRCQETMGDIIAQTRFENISKTSNDPLLARGNTLQSGEDSLKLNELIELCTNLQQRDLDLKTTKTTQANEIASLKRRVKKLERRNKSRTYGLKRIYRVGSSKRVESSKDEGLGEEDASKPGRIADIDSNKDIYLVNVHTDEDMFGVDDLDGDEVIVDNVDVVKIAEETVNAATTVSTASTIPVSAAITTTTTTVITDDEITLAKALAELKSAKPPTQGIAFRKPSESITTTPTLTTTTTVTTITVASTRPKDKGIVIHEQEQAPTPTVSLQQPSQVKVQDNGKGKMVEQEPVKKMSKKDLLRLDEELAFKLQAEKEEEEERLAREKAQQIKEVNIAWDDIQAKVEADYQKYFAAKRAEEKRNIPPTRAQQRSIMCTYLKNIEGWKPKSLKNKSFANIQELFEKVMKRVNTFVDYRTELVEESSKKATTEQEEGLKKAEAEIAQESSSKRVGEELEQESSKKQKVEEDKESEELKQCLEIVPDDGDDVTIDATPLSIKYPTIIDYKIYKEGKKSNF